MIGEAYGQQWEEADYQVIFEPPSNCDKEAVDNVRSLGVVEHVPYTVIKEDAGSSWSTLTLKEFPDKSVNSIFFKRLL